MLRVDDSANIGKRFGNWLVLGTGIKKGKHYGWMCRCNCGTERVIERMNVLRGLSTQCSSCRKWAGSSNPAWRGYGDVPQQFWTILQKSAEVRGIDVSISIEDLDILWKKSGRVCALSGVPIILATKQSGCTASIDRIDPSIGYSKDNIQWVHKDVNIMKNRFSQDRFIEVCKMVAGNN